MKMFLLAKMSKKWYSSGEFKVHNWNPQFDYLELCQSLFLYVTYNWLHIKIEWKSVEN